MGNRLVAYKLTSPTTRQFVWQAKIASGLDINHLWMKERTSLAGEDIVFGCSKAAGSSTNTAFQIFRVKVGSSYALSDLRGYTIAGPSGTSGLTCNSLRAVSDTVLYVNV